MNNLVSTNNRKKRIAVMIIAIMMVLTVMPMVGQYHDAAPNPNPNTVINTQDGGPGSFRVVASEAPDGSTVEFEIPITDEGYDSGTGKWTIDLSSEVLIVNKNITVDGNGTIILDGGQSNRTIYASADSSTLVLRGLTIQNGYTVESDKNGNGGGVNVAGALIAEECVFTNNTAIWGGAIYSMFDTDLYNCIITNNEASEGGGGVISYAGGIFAVNTIFTKNTTGSEFSGALFSFNYLYLYQCTVVDNNGAGIHIYTYQQPSAFLYNNIVAGNTGPQMLYGDDDTVNPLVFYDGVGRNLVEDVDDVTYESIFGNNVVGRDGKIYPYTGGLADKTAEELTSATVLPSMIWAYISNYVPEDLEGVLRGNMVSYGALETSKARNQGGAGKYTITVSSDNGSTVDPTGRFTVSYGQNVTIEYDVKPGYRISSVTIDGADYPELVSENMYIFRDVKSNHSFVISTVYVGTESVKVDISGQGSVFYSVNGEGFVEYDRVFEITKGSSVSFRAVPSGDLEVHWSGTISSDELDITVLNAQSDISLSAEFREDDDGGQNSEQLWMWLLILIIILLIIAAIIFLIRRGTK
jgi:hypothetical protein